MFCDTPNLQEGIMFKQIWETLNQNYQEQVFNSHQ